MRRPPLGICLPVEIKRVIDGDTMVVSIPESRWEWHIRLIDCWAPALSKPGGVEAKQYAEKTLKRCAHPVVYIPAPPGTNNLLSKLSFERIPGFIFVTSRRTLNEMLVSGGHATRERPE